MSGSLILIQFLNGLQLGVLLFLLAAGLTLVFGIMDFVTWRTARSTCWAPFLPQA
jgi:branched-subunit amino acid ABC-type transport system permease component